MSFCEYCGSKRSDTAKYCPQCGKPTADISQAAGATFLQKANEVGATNRELEDNLQDSTPVCILEPNAEYIAIRRKKHRNLWIIAMLLASFLAIGIFWAFFRQYFQAPVDKKDYLQSSNEKTIWEGEIK